MRLKEVKISIHRKYTKDFQSYGYRIGVMFDVDKVDNARTCYYSGKAFLNERIAEEDLIIKNLMAKKVAEKSSGYKELGDIPAKLVDPEGVKWSERDMGYVKKIMGETGMSRDDVINLVREKMNLKALKGRISVKGAVFVVGKELGVGVFESEKKDLGGGYKELEKREVGVGDVDGEVVMIPFDVKQIKRTSPKAVLVELFGNKGDLWIPKSCVGDGDAMDLMQKGVKSQLFVASWFLIKSGLIIK